MTEPLQAIRDIADALAIRRPRLMRMPGLGKRPQALSLDVTDEGESVNLR
jgi:formyltetrahydrofolate synthetase